MHFEVVKGVLVLAGLLALCPPAFFSHLCPALGICGHSNSDVQVMCYLFKQLPLSHFQGCSDSALERMDLGEEATFSSHLKREFWGYRSPELSPGREAQVLDGHGPWTLWAPHPVGGVWPERGQKRAQKMWGLGEALFPRYQGSTVCVISPHPSCVQGLCQAASPASVSVWHLDVTLNIGAWWKVHLRQLLKP